MEKQDLKPLMERLAAQASFNQIQGVKSKVLTKTLGSGEDELFHVQLHTTVAKNGDQTPTEFDHTEEAVFKKDHFQWNGDGWFYTSLRQLVIETEDLLIAEGFEIELEDEEPADA